MSKHTFLARLRRVIPTLRSLGPQESKTFDVQAQFGEYHITIGPEYSATHCRQLHVPLHSRPIQVEGEIDHLFLEPDQVCAFPSRELVNQQLRTTVVINGVRVHIFDLHGDGASYRANPTPASRVEIRQAINLAGPEGEDRLVNYQRSGALTRETYRIIQEDVLKLLRQHAWQGKRSSLA